MAISRGPHAHRQQPLADKHLPALAQTSSFAQLRSDLSVNLELLTWQKCRTFNHCGGIYVRGDGLVFDAWEVLISLT